MSIAEPVIRWFGENGRDLPWRRPGFTPWGTLVSEFMLQQTPVVRVIPRLEAWLERWPTPSDLAAVPVSEALRAWDRLGYPRRAMYLHACAVVITERHGGIVPESVDVLLALPGVGEYTARAVAVFAYGQRHPVVDTNVRRVLARAIGGQAAPGRPSTKQDLEAMEAVLPDSFVDARIANAAIMELGALVCTARVPRCERCPIAELCAWRAVGHPKFTGKGVAIQKKFAGSDRQVRGLIMAELRTSDVPVTIVEIEAVWPDAAGRDRALAGLLRDGLATGSSEVGYSLPE